jgi:hypothetical protein
VLSTGIREVVADGIITEDGEHHPADTIILGTGFDTNNFLAPIDFRGCDGVSIRGGGPRGPRRTSASRWPTTRTSSCSTDPTQTWATTQSSS